MRVDADVDTAVPTAIAGRSTRTHADWWPSGLGSSLVDGLVAGALRAVHEIVEAARERHTGVLGLVAHLGALADRGPRSVWPGTIAASCPSPTGIGVPARDRCSVVGLTRGRRRLPSARGVRRGGLGPQVGGAHERAVRGACAVVPRHADPEGAVRIGQSEQVVVTVGCPASIGGTWPIQRADPAASRSRSAGMPDEVTSQVDAADEAAPAVLNADSRADSLAGKRRPRRGSA